MKVGILLCCSQFSEKVDIVWNPNHTVTYRQVRRWYFDHENSNGSLNDNVTLLNVVPVVRQDVFYLYKISLPVTSYSSFRTHVTPCCFSVTENNIC
jgi:hypothetical protein